MNNYTAKNILPTDLYQIVRKYGNNIEDIYDLGPGQKWMFGEKKNNKSAFFLQMTIMTEMELDPATFRKKVDSECERRDTLRFAYVYKGLSKPYCVCLKNRRSEISFEDISNIAQEDVDRALDVASAADRRRGFDLENDPLLRIHVYKVHGDNKFVFIISQPHINSDGTSMGILIKDIFIDYALKIDTPFSESGEGDYKSVADFRNSIDINKELGYWKNYLEDAENDISLPGKINTDKEFEETVYVSVLPPDLEDGLATAGKKYKTTTFNILQASWGIMLNRITGRKDVLFGAITSGREVSMFKSMSIPGGFVKVIPVRMRIDDDQKITDIFTDLQKDFVLSIENSHVSIDEIKGTIGRKAELFDHVLNCHNFAGNKGFSKDAPEIQGIKILVTNVYDNLSEDLAVYIRPTQSGTELAVGYNASVFSRETVQLYAETFQRVLRQILNSEPEMTVGELDKYDRSLFEYTANLQQCDELKKTMLLKKHPIFALATWDQLVTVARQSTIKSYLEGDRVFDEKENIDYLPILISGKVFTKATSMSGWLNPIKACKPGSVLSYAAIFRNSSTEVMADVGSNEATVLKVPVKAFRRLVQINPQLIYIIMEELYKECIKYEKLWLEA